MKIIINVWWIIYEMEKWWCVVKMVFLGDNISYRTNHVEMSSFQNTYTTCLRKNSEVVIYGCKGQRTGKREIWKTYWDRYMDQHNGIQYKFQNEWDKLNTAAQYIHKMKAMNSKTKYRFLSLQIVRHYMSIVYTLVCTARMLRTQ